MRATLSADIYNLMNAAPVLSYNEAFIPGRRVAAADVDHDRALRPAERAGGFLDDPAGPQIRARGLHLATSRRAAA